MRCSVADAAMRFSAVGSRNERADSAPVESQGFLDDQHEYCINAVAESIVHSGPTNP